MEKQIIANRVRWEIKLISEEKLRNYKLITESLSFTKKTEDLRVPRAMIFSERFSLPAL
ncbi:protein of unknown function [Legionella pneumophila subsp. pneumophila]|uniref:Uncharacterized protein n=1 Tax=Legionella pneumophila subsp. pneumophila TaxID=91891 RepID=A0AAV2UYT9_LEGPN|nr:protein of unknown function [Legionella pneumophila subsp. pneumophila]